MTDTGRTFDSIFDSNPAALKEWQDRFHGLSLCTEPGFEHLSWNEYNILKGDIYDFKVVCDEENDKSVLTDQKSLFVEMPVPSLSHLKEKTAIYDEPILNSDGTVDIPMFSSVPRIVFNSTVTHKGAVFTELVNSPSRPIRDFLKEWAGIIKGSEKQKIEITNYVRDSISKYVSDTVKPSTFCIYVNNGEMDICLADAKSLERYLLENIDRSIKITCYDNQPVKSSYQWGSNDPVVRTITFQWIG